MLSFGSATSHPTRRDSGDKPSTSPVRSSIAEPWTMRTALSSGKPSIHGLFSQERPDTFDLQNKVAQMADDNPRKPLASRVLGNIVIPEPPPSRVLKARIPSAPSSPTSSKQVSASQVEQQRKQIEKLKREGKLSPEDLALAERTLSRYTVEPEPQGVSSAEMQKLEQQSKTAKHLFSEEDQVLIDRVLKNLKA